MAKRKPNFERHRPSASPDSLHGHSGRTEAGGVWLHGRHVVAAALANPERRCRRLLLTVEAHHAIGESWRDQRPQGEYPVITIETATREGIDALLPAGCVHQGAALLAESLPPQTISDLCAEAADMERAIIVVLDQVTDPHNIGAVLRSAAAFGAIGLVMQDRHAPEETGTLAKAASGAMELVPLVRTVNLARSLDELKAGGFWCIGLDASAETTLADARLSGRVALVLGSEGEGLRRLVRENCDLLVRLPIAEAIESLNVSNAAAVAMYELVREIKD